MRDFTNVNVNLNKVLVHFSLILKTFVYDENMPTFITY